MKTSGVHTEADCLNTEATDANISKIVTVANSRAERQSFGSFFCSIL